MLNNFFGNYWCGVLMFNYIVKPCDRCTLKHKFKVKLIFTSFWVHSTVTNYKKLYSLTGFIILQLKILKRIFLKSLFIDFIHVLTRFYNMPCCTSSLISVLCFWNKSYYISKFIYSYVTILDVCYLCICREFLNKRLSISILECFANLRLCVKYY